MILKDTVAMRIESMTRAGLAKGTSVSHIDPTPINITSCKILIKRKEKKKKKENRNSK